ncbi:MAG: hypothetical protein H3C58_06150 [Fimbriimonadaceae bacterium]|nr:hypothetical protein [Fimbriimonadaceae bacterium]
MIGSVDLLVLLKVCSKGDSPWDQAQIAWDLFVSQSTVSMSLRRAAEVRLYSPSLRRVNATGLQEALIHGAKYFLAPIRGGITVGMPTCWAVSPFKGRIVPSDELPPVWPDPEGTVRGLSFEPLYRTAPKAAALDAGFYELLAIVDVLRDGRPREVAMAKDELAKRLCVR